MFKNMQDITEVCNTRFADSPLGRQCDYFKQSEVDSSKVDQPLAMIDKYKDISCKNDSYEGDSRRLDKIVATITADDEKTVYKFDNNLDGSLKNEVSEKGKPIQNKIDGLQREAEVREELVKKYPPEEGYEIISEAYLRDADGNIVKDPETGKARRIDFVVVKDGKVIDSIEVTSKTADKSDQLAKENRIREFGGNYIRDNNGNLIKIPSSVQTRVERRD